MGACVGAHYVFLYACRVMKIFPDVIKEVVFCWRTVHMPNPQVLLILRKVSGSVVVNDPPFIWSAQTQSTSASKTWSFGNQVIINSLKYPIVFSYIDKNKTTKKKNQGSLCYFTGAVYNLFKFSVSLLICSQVNNLSIWLVIMGISPQWYPIEKYLENNY